MGNLKQIKGIGKRNEYYLQSIGINHIDGLTAYQDREPSSRHMIINRFPLRVPPYLESLQNWIQQAQVIIRIEKNR